MASLGSLRAREAWQVELTGGGSSAAEWRQAAPTPVTRLQAEEPLAQAALWGGLPDCHQLCGFMLVDRFRPHPAPNLALPYPQAQPIISSKDSMQCGAASTNLTQQLQAWMLPPHPGPGRLDAPSGPLSSVCGCAASVKLMYEPQPKPARISKFTDMTIRAVACGAAHTVALNDKGEAFSWGEHHLGFSCAGTGRRHA